MSWQEDLERTASRLRTAGLVVTVDGHQIRGGTRLVQFEGWVLFLVPFAIEASEAGWILRTAAMFADKSVESPDAAVDEVLLYCQRDDGTDKGQINSDPHLSGGSPTLGGTRLTCGNIVELVASLGIRETLRTHDTVSETELRRAIGYCARQECKSRGVEVPYCQGCTLDTRPADDDEVRSEVWKLAEMLVDRADVDGGNPGQ